ncbi:MAG: diaminopimelate decarboxylase [Firmicutes bacterium]|uniref:Diaminopimelate decarboxylase n=1 Tax=Melghirimyces thermohalophilus TaxID=1236220 RepID=A0A1G6LMN3_9BACL|nr:diaminopimelate decarboxylase [Melghirimyces thermohalophilus]MDA8353802.1 diaminopimelate decarboxylase [Bacillota bacterium]SDC44493.1 diaminopimelate decarboxylase [Melghirimyces thermohalophilus]
MQLRGTSRINEQGHLEIGGVDSVDLSRRFGTPLYVMDEQMIRERMRAFINAFRKTGLSFQVAYASKAFSTLAMCRLVEEEGLYLDVVSDGELYTALKANFPPERIYFHGNNKTPEELEMGLKAGIGWFVVDNFTELSLLNSLAQREGITVRILLRTTPGVEAHTHDYIQTGQEDSKFGFDLGNGQVKRAIQQSLQSERLQLDGFHCHIGSQIFGAEGFRLAVQKMAALTRESRAVFGFHPRILNLGGGFGIRYQASDRPIPIEEYVSAIAEEIRAGFSGETCPEIWLEPGRSIVGEAGTTLYRVGSTKEVPGIRKYVAVDGGMNDNPRPALYQATYEAIVANRAAETPQERISVAGKLCESGDMLIWDLDVPKVETGDVLAVLSTGAYNYSMANNYNRLRRPAVVFVRDGQADLVVQRERLDDLLQNDRIPERMMAVEPVE